MKIDHRGTGPSELEGKGQQGAAPPGHEETKTSTLLKRGTGESSLIDHHLQGLTLLYFKRDKEGSIGECRAEINEQVGRRHIVKSINFLGDSDNNITEVLVSSKFARWFV